jgi:16S rRNA (cytidine1402-2'-O)-methyltransferase
MTVFLVATPIGNLDDITLRALRVLKEVDLVACEDTRHTRRLLDHFNIRVPTISYHEHNERDRAQQLVARAKQGEKIAIVSDAGMPAISDPAYRIVRAAIEQGVPVIPIPGATALAVALVASGLPTDSFFFAGFLPPRRQARRTRLKELRGIRSTLVLYEAPHRIAGTLVDAQEVLGDRQAALARELTKVHEEFIRGRLSEIGERLSAQGARGEMTLIIDVADGPEETEPGAGKDDSVGAGSLTEHVQRVMEEGLSRSEALKQAARSRGLTRRAAYRQLLEEKQKNEDQT